MQLNGRDFPSICEALGTPFPPPKKKEAKKSYKLGRDIQNAVFKNIKPYSILSFL
jgi:hypothetical protein